MAAAAVGVLPITEMSAGRPGASSGLPSGLDGTMKAEIFPQSCWADIDVLAASCPGMQERRKGYKKKNFIQVRRQLVCVNSGLRLLLQIASLSSMTMPEPAALAHPPHADATALQLTFCTTFMLWTQNGCPTCLRLS